MTSSFTYTCICSLMSFILLVFDTFFKSSFFGIFQEYFSSSTQNSVKISKSMNVINKNIIVPYPF
jgi:hypothetical protein